MAQPTLPQFSEFCLQTLLENWSNYFSDRIKQNIARFKFANQVLGAGIDGNTFYLFESSVFTETDIAAVTALNVFDADISMDGTLVVNPIDETLEATITTGGTTFYVPANTGQKQFHWDFPSAQTVVAVNCEYQFHHAVMVCTKS